MSTLTKVFVVLNTVVAIALASLTVATAAQWENWKELSKTYQTERDAAIQKQQSTAATAQVSLAMKDEAIAARDRDIQALRSEVESLTNEKNALTGNLTQERNARLAAEASRTKMEEILGVNTAELKAVQKQNQAMLAQNMELQSRNARLNSRVLELTTSVQILTDQVRDIREKLAAAEAQSAQTAMRDVEPLANAAPVEPRTMGEIRGQVVAVEGNLAELNIGESVGVVPGMRFMIQTDSAYLCDFVAERVRPNATAGRLDGTGADEVRPGLTAVNVAR